MKNLKLLTLLMLMVTTPMIKSADGSTQAQSDKSEQKAKMDQKKEEKKAKIAAKKSSVQAKIAEKKAARKAKKAANTGTDAAVN